MRNEYYDFLKVFVEKLIDSTYTKDNNIIVVKHYNTFDLKEDDICSIVEEYGNGKYSCFYRRFHRKAMPDALDPFLHVIKEMYHKYYSEQTIEDFLDSVGVYSLHRAMFCSYLKNSLCYRDEDLISSEVGYEQQVLKDTIVRMLIKISNEHPIVLCINGLNGASKTTLELMEQLLDSQENGRIILVAAYNDLRIVLPHVVKTWENFVKRLENLNCVVDGSLFNKTVPMEPGVVFRFEEERIDEYVVKLSNMFHMLEFEDASYYLSVIYKKIELETLSSDDIGVERFELLKIYAKVCIYSEDIAMALLLCNSLNDICKQHSSFHMSYQYNYLLGLTQLYNGKLHMARVCSEVCYQMAKEDGSEFLMFKARMLKHMTSMSGWHNLLFCANDIVIDDKILRQAEEYEYYNHLAHSYIYAFDNEMDWTEEIETLSKRLVNFNKGMEIAKSIGNKHLMMEGYRKNIMLSSINGAFDVTTYYYGLMSKLVGDSDPMKAADIYKGLGYNMCAMEKYEEANKEYNKAIEIYYSLGMMEYVGECLYNMSINCILGKDYRTAYDNLLMCIRIIEALHLNDLRVCNISKLFGLLGLCSYRLGMYYNCKTYTEKTMQFLSHKLNASHENHQDIDPSYTVCDDDMFLHFYVKGLWYMQKGMLKEALKDFESAEIYAVRSKGYQFFSYVQYRISKAELFRLMNKEEKAMDELRDAYAYAENSKATEKMRIIKAVMDKTEPEEKEYHLPCESVTLEEIRIATEQAGINKNYLEIKKQLDFIGVWQKIVDITGKEKEELIVNALNSFIVNFNIDKMVYINYKDDVATVDFQNREEPLSQQDLDVLTGYFKKQRSGFVASKMRKDFQEYRDVISVFGMNDVCSMIAIPFYVKEELCNLFVCYIQMKDNWNSATSKYLMNENDYNIYSLVLSQLVNAVSMLEKQKEINEKNIQLANSAVTDYLTTLLNRDGFFTNVHKQVEKATRNKKKLDLTVLYIDLDNFKYYNDTFGHDVGDLVLKEIAKILKQQSQEGGFAVRFGGDEFLIILNHADGEKAMKKAREVLSAILGRNAFIEEIREFLGRDDIVIPKEKQVSCSIGVAPAANIKGDEDIAKAIKRADGALYKIKHSTKCDCELAE